MFHLNGTVTFDGMQSFELLLLEPRRSASLGRVNHVTRISGQEAADIFNRHREPRLQHFGCHSRAVRG